MQRDNAVTNSQMMATDFYNNTSSAGPQWLARRARGAPGTASGVSADDELQAIGADGHNTSAFTGASKARMVTNAAETWSPTANGTYTHWDETLSGTATRCEKMRLRDDGTLELREPQVGATCGVEHTGFQAQAQTANIEYKMPAAAASVVGSVL